MILQAIKHQGPGATYDIKDSEGNRLGIARKKIITLKIEMTLKNQIGEKILVARGPSGKDKIYDIDAIDDNNIAKFAIRSKDEKNSWWNPKYQNVCYLKIVDLDVNRKRLLGLLISIISSFYDYEPGGAM